MSDAGAVRGRNHAGAAGEPTTLATEPRREDMERWAAALVGQLTARPELNLLLNPAPQAAVAASWRGADNALTEGDSAAGLTAGADVQPTGGDGHEAPALESLTLELDGGSMGRIRVLVDRGPDGLRVLLGVENQLGALGLGPERASLEAALRATGLTGANVSIVQVNRDGPLLARRVLSADAPRAYRGATREDGSSRETSRGIKLIG